MKRGLASAGPTPSPEGRRPDVAPGPVTPSGTLGLGPLASNGFRHPRDWRTALVYSYAGGERAKRGL